MEVLKTFFVILIGAALLRNRQHLDWLVWVIVFSIGFFGVKGGLFTILSGGLGRVYGPPGDSYISDNNAISVALVMTIPLMHYLRQISKGKWIRLGLLGAMLLSGMAVLGSQSRGALVAVSAMGFFLWLKTKNKVMMAMALLALVPVALVFMPESWTSRMQSIGTYEEDPSAMGRINAWHAAINVANDRLTGAGFEWYTLRNFATYAPNPQDLHSAHSIYFQILGEHGYIGLLLFLSLGMVGWFNARKAIAASRGHEEIEWVGQLARAIQVSLIGYAVGGMFVNIGYWDLPYIELVILALLVKLATAPRPSKAELAPLPHP